MDCILNYQVERGWPKGEFQFNYSQFVIYDIFIEVTQHRYNMKLFIVGTLLALANALSRDGPVVADD